MYSLPIFPQSLTLLVLFASMWLSPIVASAQQTPANTAQKPGSAVAANTVLGAPAWAGLSPRQQQSLAPLAGTWDSLSDGQRRKWLVLAQTYPSLTASEKQKLHSRMAEWAALKPKDREQARLNFAETKKIAPSDLTANWEAYQALSPEERKKLAAGANPKPAGAATAIKPVPAAKLAEVPKASKSFDTKQPLVAKPEALNRNTLLPIVEVHSSQQTETPSN